MADIIDEANQPGVLEGSESEIPNSRASVVAGYKRNAIAMRDAQTRFMLFAADPLTGASDSLTAWSEGSFDVHMSESLLRIYYLPN
jgi:hypothetical protein